MAAFCPYCDQEIEDDIHKDWVGDYWEYADDFKCPNCQKILEIDVEMEPVFVVHKSKRNNS